MTVQSVANHEAHASGDSHYPDSIGVAIAEEIRPGGEWIMLEGRLHWHPAAEYTLTREFNGDVLQSVKVQSFKDAIKALWPMAVEDETVQWLCTCACSDDIDDLIHKSLKGTRLANLEPTN